MVVPFGNVEVYKPLLLVLNKKSIWYEEIGKLTLKFKKSDFETILKLSKEISNNILPIGHSAAYNKEIQIKLKSRLNELQLYFKTVCIDKIEFLVWNKEDTNTIELLVSEIKNNKMMVSNETVACT